MPSPIIRSGNTVPYDPSGSGSSGGSGTDSGVLELMLTAGGGTPSTTSGSGDPEKTEYTTNDVDLYLSAFDSVANEYMQWSIWMPTNWNGGTLSFEVMWTAASGSGDVIWGLQGRAYAEDDAIDAAWGDPQYVTDTLINTGDIHISATGTDVVLAGAPAGGQLIQLRLFRNAASELDTIAADVSLISVKVYCLAGASIGTELGESNTASNVGVAGVGVFKEKSGVELRFKNINAGSNKITITDDTDNNEIDIDVDESNFEIQISDLSDVDTTGVSDNQPLTYNLSELNWEPTGELDLTNINFDTTYAGGFTEGVVGWDSENGTLSVGMPGDDVVLQVGQEILRRVKNAELVTITNGTPVYIFNATGGVTEVKVAAITTHDIADAVIGVATEDIASNQFGYITILGVVRDLDTSSFVEGDTVYVSDTGTLVTFESVASAATVLIGTVLRVHATEGSVYVRIQKDPHLFDLSDVNLSSPSDGDVLTYDNATSKWVASAPSGSATQLSELTDVDLTGLADGDILEWDSTAGDWIPVEKPNPSGTGESANYVLNEGAYYQTVLTSWTDVDATNLSLTINTNGGDVLVGFHGLAWLVNTAATERIMKFDITVDGTPHAGDDGIAIIYSPTGVTVIQHFSFVRMITGLSAGSHTFNLQWAINDGTNCIGRLHAGEGTTNRDTHPQFWVKEL